MDTATVPQLVKRLRLKYKADVFVYFSSCQTNPMETAKLTSALVRLSILHYFPRLSVALSPKPIGSYLR